MEVIVYFSHACIYLILQCKWLVAPLQYDDKAFFVTEHLSQKILYANLHSKWDK